jgi:hypothetical protein
MKVAVANASSIKKLGRISENWGTALETIKASYDIESDWVCFWNI